MRPKTESYDQDVRLVILRTARYDDAAEEVEAGVISIFLAPAFVITVRQGAANELRGARQFRVAGPAPGQLRRIRHLRHRRPWWCRWR
jgi:hypothetical protein